MSVINEERLMYSVLTAVTTSILNSPAYGYMYNASLYASVVYEGARPSLVKMTVVSEHDGWHVVQTERYSIQEAVSSFGTWPQTVEMICKSMLDEMWKEKAKGMPPKRGWSS